MKIIYTKHALEKLNRYDIKNFKINKNLIKNILLESKHLSKTKYGDYATVASLDEDITFHVSGKGRYK